MNQKRKNVNENSTNENFANENSGNEEFGQEMLAYINNSPTAYHAVSNGVKLLKEQGFKELKEQDNWKLKEGGKYFVTKNLSGFIAFTIGEKELVENGFRIIGAHTDSPGFKIKPGTCTVTEDGYVKMNTELYGGMIISTWFDRPLSMAGRLVLKEPGGKIAEKIVDIKEPLFMIPNLGIHLQRDINEKSGYNKQADIFPLLCMKKEKWEKADYLLNLIENRLHLKAEDVLDYELFLYEYEKGICTGEEGEFVSASRLDDLSMVFCGIKGLTGCGSRDYYNVLAAFDNEEVGSQSIAGAGSHFLHHTLKRICNKIGLDEEGYFRTLAQSSAISADTAHAVHPNYSAKHDPENRPVLGGGPVIKYSAAQKYATTAVTAAYFIKACEEAGVPYQKYVNRNDIPGGSTIGPISSGMTTVPTVDIGTPVLAMHSVREFGCVADNIYAAKAFQAYYGMEIG